MTKDPKVKLITAMQIHHHRPQTNSNGYVVRGTDNRLYAYCDHCKEPGIIDNEILKGKATKEDCTGPSKPKSQKNAGDQ